MAARKLPITLAVLLAANVGLTAVRADVAGAEAAVGDSAVLAWNQRTLDAIAATKTAPTIAARALAVVHTAIYDAWAAYDPVAVDTRQRLRANPDLRQPTAEQTLENKAKAISFAAYAALVDLFRAQPQRDNFATQMRDLDFVIDGSDTSTAAMVGGAAAQAVLDYRHQDGANQLGDRNGGAPYSDYTGYTPVNTWDQVKDPDRWQPLCLPLPPPGATECTGRIQTFLTPFWSRVTPFALTRPDQFRAPGPYTYLGPDGKPSSKYDDEIDKMTQYSKQLDDTRKTMAEYWEDGPGSVTPPGHWNQFAQWVARRDTQHHRPGRPAVLRPQWCAVGCQHQRLGRQAELGLDPAHQRRAVAAAGQDHPGLGWPLQRPVLHQGRRLATLSAPQRPRPTLCRVRLGPFHLLRRRGRGPDGLLRPGQLRAGRHHPSWQLQGRTENGDPAGGAGQGDHPQVDQLPVRRRAGRTVASVRRDPFRARRQDARAAGASVGKNAWAKALTYFTGTAS